MCQGESIVKFHQTQKKQNRFRTVTIKINKSRLHKCKPIAYLTDTFKTLIFSQKKCSGNFEIVHTKIDSNFFFIYSTRLNFLLPFSVKIISNDFLKNGENKDAFT